MRNTFYTLSLFLLLLVTVLGQEEYNVFQITIPSSPKSLEIDTSGIPDAVVGIGVDYDSIHKTSDTSIAIHVFGTDAVVKQDAGKWVVSYKTPPGPATECASGGIFSTMPNILLCVLMVFLCSEKRNKYLMLLLSVIVILGSVSSVPPVRIIIYLPETTLDRAYTSTSPLNSLKVNAHTVALLTPELHAGTDRISVSCQVKGEDQQSCGVQICDFDNRKTCLIPDGEAVGVLLPLTGRDNTLGDPIKESIAYYVNLDGFSVPYIQYIVCDTQATPSLASSCVDTLVSEGVFVFIGPLSSSEAQAIKTNHPSDVIMISPTVTASQTFPFVSLSMGNLQYVVAVNMIIENDFANTLENVIVIYRDDVYGKEIYNDMLAYFESSEVLHPFPYSTASGYPDLQSVVTAAGETEYNHTAVIVVAFGEVKTILEYAMDVPLLGNYPWYSIALSFNPGLINETVIDFSRKVQFKTLDFRGSNIEAHTADRTTFYEEMTTKFNRSLPASPALGFDAALLIANTPEIFETTANQGYYLLVKQGDITFGLSGWLSLDETGFRANGDFISQIVETESIYRDDWLELGYVELDRHKFAKTGDSAYYEITFRVVSNYLIPGNWSVELEDCDTARIDIYARNIDRRWDFYGSVDLTNPLDAYSLEDVAVPLYDSFFIQYTCNAYYFTQFCPSALYGSDTQCSRSDADLRPYINEPEKRYVDDIFGISQGGATRTVCTNAASLKGCVSATGAPAGCPKTNSTCASEGYKSACAAKSGGFCSKKA